MNIKAVGKTVYVLVLIAVIAVSIVATYYVTTMTAPTDGEKPLKIGLISYPYADAWCGAAFTTTKWYLEDHGCEVSQVVGSVDWSGMEQLKGGKALIDLGVDGIILTPTQPTVVAELVEYATEHGVPVACFDTPVDSSDILFYVGVSQYELGREAGLEAREYLIQKYGEVKGTVLVLTLPPSRVYNKERADGYESAFKDDSNVTLEELMIEVSGTLVDAKIAVESYLEAGKDFDVAWCSTGGTNLGIVEALESKGIDPSTKILVGSDCYPKVLELIREGKMTGSTDQPTAFYGAITAKYLIDYIEGKQIPEMDDVINNLNIEGNLHFGYDPWAYDNEVYLPVEVVDFKSNVGATLGEGFTSTFTWYKIGVVLVDKSNVNMTSLWGNSPIDWARVS